MSPSAERPLRRREIPAALRLGGYVAAVVVAFGAAYAIGGAINPVDPVAEAAEPAEPEGHSDMSAAPEEDGSHDAVDSASPPGLSVSQSGYTLRLRRFRAAEGA